MGKRGELLRKIRELERKPTLSSFAKKTELEGILDAARQAARMPSAQAAKRRRRRRQLEKAGRKAARKGR